MNILEKIVAHKREEVASRKELYPTALLERSIYFKSPTVSLSKYLLRTDKQGLIAEFKRKSPSKGDINRFAKVQRVSLGYMQAGASALSVLTDNHFFGGKSEDLTEARKFNYCPILRKDFVIDEYQIIEARSIGADAVLLIAEVLEKEQVKALAEVAAGLGLEVLMEVHSEGQLDKVCDAISLVGVNNRNLETFEVNLDTSRRLASLIPSDKVRVSESGIHSAADAADLRAHGYNGFLIGEQFMKTSDPRAACVKFLKELRELEGEGQSDEGREEKGTLKEDKSGEVVS